MQSIDHEGYQRLLDVAETLFAAHGYQTVRLRDIADMLGVKHSALYYYVPEGKEQLYMHVMERSLNRHRKGMEAALAEADPDLRVKMHAISTWLLAQPPMNLARMDATDYPALHPENAQKLSMLVFDSLRLPIFATLQEAQEQGRIQLPDLNLAAITFVTLVEIIHADTSEEMLAEKGEVIERLIDMLLYGWLKR